MEPGDKSAALADEQALNRDYMQYLAEKAGSVVPVSQSRSAAWTGSQQARVPRPEIAPFVGRVGLVREYDAIGADSFYIGPWWCPKLDVYSWAAPIAAAYYGTADHDELEELVVITRAFQSKGPQLIDFADERQLDAPELTPFDKRRALVVRRPPRAADVPAPTEEWRPPRPTTPPALPERATPTPTPTARSRRDTPVLRHREAVVQALTAPRGAGLQHLLSTLQPDQYRLITRPYDSSLVIQGHPGSGKTVVALHRAAYLADDTVPERKPLKRVLVLGPTPEFVRHASPVLRQLQVPERIFLSSMPSLLRLMLPDLAERPAPGNEDYRDYDDELKDVIDSLAVNLRDRGLLTSSRSLSERTRRIYDTLRQVTRPHGRDALDPEWVRYLRSLPGWDAALDQERFGPLLAYCSLVARESPPQSYEHLLVDEAQDVRPLEWHILRALNGGTWTLVGDMNQRRSDACLGSWDLVQRAVGIDPRVPVDEFSAVYRSTAAILAYSGALLPAAERKALAVRDDEHRPDVRQVRAGELASSVVTVLDGMAARHPAGALAVIATDPASARAPIVKAGWRRQQGGQPVWERGGVTLRLLFPHQARGLEFDGVVVMEPHLFPMNLGRYGVLYTSLTRANRELAVVHSQPLPEPLRKQRLKKATTRAW